LTFGAGGGGGVGHAGGGDSAGGKSGFTEASGAARDRCEGEVKVGDSTRFVGGDCTRLRGSKKVRDCGDGERATRNGGHGVMSDSRGSLSTSICTGPQGSASGEEMEVMDKKEDVKVDNLGERGDELEE
jgi:hypothetical protein